MVLNTDYDGNWVAESLNQLLTPTAFIKATHIFQKE